MAKLTVIKCQGEGCGVSVETTSPARKWGDGCREQKKRERRRQKIAKPTVIECKACGVLIEKTGQYQKWCDACRRLRKNEDNRRRYWANREKSREQIECQGCGVLIERTSPNRKW